MLVLDAEMLAKLFVRGSLSKEQFVSFSASLAQIEQEAPPGNFLKKCIQLYRCPKDLRNYTIKWRIKSVWRFFKYSSLAMTAITIIALSRLDSGDLQDMWHSGVDMVEFTEMVVAGTPEPLPEDMQLAVEYLLENTAWARLHVKQIRTQLSALSNQEKILIQEKHWFHEFALMVAIKKVEKQKQLVDGNPGVTRYLSELSALNELLSS